MCVERVYVQRKKKILKAAKMTIGSANSKVVSFIWHPVVDKMKSLLIKWIDGCTKHEVPLSSLILKRN